MGAVYDKAGHISDPSKLIFRAYESTRFLFFASHSSEVIGNVFVRLRRDMLGLSKRRIYCTSIVFDA